LEIGNKVIHNTVLDKLNKCGKIIPHLFNIKIIKRNGGEQMKKNLKKFGMILKNLRIKNELSLRDICKKTEYNPSNWSKIERGLISPPADKKILIKWAKILGLCRQKESQEFIDKARIAQGIIPGDIMTCKNAVNALPAFFRTLRNEKPTKAEIDNLIELIKNP